MFRVAAQTNIGPRKKSNQDSCCIEVIQTSSGEAALVAVCDGVGGLSQGEVASASVVTWLVNWFETMFVQTCERLASDPAGVLNIVQSQWSFGLDRMNTLVRDYGRDHDTQLGTTFTAILFYQGRYLIGHVGDTRVYRFAGGEMEILTKDQTWVAQEVARGNIPPEKARFHPKRNVILQSVGTQSELQPVFGSGTYEVGETYMVCCDGFRNELFDDELVESFGSLSHATEEQIQQSCDSLIKLVLERGERDNITVACLCCQDDETAETTPLGGE
ncbi:MULTISPECIES: PP2C family serine/threonine-protein phosphatase [unclassified Adlercreutzia]|uniref:PP2C family protein-serine/threonine phosphatase n=1 Tax=unclassified Adlercreutzia TaxID=2636013 RepID=UPI0013EA2F2A|nr:MULTISPECIES: PP2C family serine/threonine-protein phosphatase [unclassified Adlercreutzia]